MYIYTDTPEFLYEFEKLTRLFFPFERIEVVNGEANLTDDLFGEVRLREENSQKFIFARAGLNGKTVEKNEPFAPDKSLDPDRQKIIERVLAATLFDVYCKLTDYKPEWGILTGIRPAKLYRRFEQEIGDKNATELFKNEFRVGDKKLELLRKTALSEDNIVSKSKSNSVSLYISVPFCPSRCSYCSFVSHSIDRAASLMPQYVELLCKEIEYTAEIIKKLGLEVLTVYMGGGTPTTLSAEQITKVLSTVRNSFDNDFLELTVEAGRPDTITKEKLVAIKNGGATRISINPQTMNDEVLNTIGRKHTTRQTLQAFEMARSVGFDNINMDLIAGLPGDTFESFKNTVESVIALNPESVTVHSLSLKRSSGMGQDKTLSFLKEGMLAGKMVDYAQSRLKEANILPYYMYRQSKTVGNLENVGYAKKGFEGLYNVYIMDETHTILACGASAVTKLKSNFDGQIERIFNFKYPYEYMAQFDEMLRRKDRVEEFYSAHTFKD